MPGSRKLFLDFLAGKTTDYFHYDFNDDSALQQVHDKVIHRRYDREKIVAALLRQNESFGAGPRTLENIRKLLQPTTSAVFTGQQVTLFGGPLFTFYKAGLALKLAESNCRKLNGQVVPIFWLAADDADFEEVAKITLPTTDNKLATMTYEPAIPIAGQPMGSVRLDEKIAEFLDSYEKTLPETEFRDSLMAMLRECYRPGESIVTAFGKYLARIFGDRGLILIDPTDPVFRELALPVFRKEVQLRERAAKLVEERNSRLEQQGYHLQVARPGSYSNLFYYNGKRTRIDFADGGFAIEGKFLTQADLEARLEKSPSLFSPNVFLRAIVQSHIFPTLVYFAGPAEAAYFSQIRDLFDVFDEAAPIIYPRFSATIIEPAISRLMEKLEIGFEDTAVDLNQLTTDILKRSFPADFEHSFAALRAEIKRQMDEIAAHLDQSDHGLI
ncbi:MAG: bacillithiol biosynthesis cysteine-adding enzyme BshC, partial [Candidatus Zixiibacteriota bacterium]